MPLPVAYDYHEVFVKELQYLDSVLLLELRLVYDHQVNQSDLVVYLEYLVELLLHDYLEVKDGV